MSRLFDVLASLLQDTRARPREVRRGARSDHCRCGRPVFFRNSVCMGCGAVLGFEPQRQQVRALAATEDGHWRLDPDVTAGATTEAAADNAAHFLRCANLDTPAGCNWLVPLAPQGLGPVMCQACRLTRTIPDLTLPENAALWRRIEIARRRLVAQLLALGLPVASRVPAAAEDPERGLMFDVLRAQPGAQPVMTGHSNGLITLNLEEADDAVRERTRAQMHEPYRTLLGHFRHEVGHYYWDRLVAGGPWLDDCRRLFGDERADYAAALQGHYLSGPAPDWALHHVSSYASAHPWEDWAETWAHYLHMVDTLDTALSFGLDASDVDYEFDRFTVDALWRPEDAGADEFLGFVNAWVELTGVLNEMSRSMGQPDFYPFVLPRPVIGKLQFVHAVVQGAA